MFAVLMACGQRRDRLLHRMWQNFLFIDRPNASNNALEHSTEQPVVAGYISYLYMAPPPGIAQYNIRLEAKAATGPGPVKCRASCLYLVPVMLIHLSPSDEVKAS